MRGGKVVDHAEIIRETAQNMAHLHLAIGATPHVGAPLVQCLKLLVPPSGREPHGWQYCEHDWQANPHWNEANGNEAGKKHSFNDSKHPEH